MEFIGTTILMVRKAGKTALGGDGQVTLGNTQVKSTASKVRKINENILVGFAGSVADSFALVERFTEKINMYKNNLRRAAVELAKEWRSDKVLRRLEAMMIVAGQEESFLLSGSGEVIEDENGLLAIGSGGSFAYAAAMALMSETNLDAEAVVRKSLDIAADICIYTNHNISVVTLGEPA
ncbi:ATP-dependent protease subunit HslV [Candidatus Mcinerneyibacteriota bacterium]|nr:ATP-dependent protease subunit HslV [Candidatus Mcinerneyibacteriota bacterium]